MFNKIMCEIIWNNNIEPGNKAEIEKYLNPYLWLVPKWCQKLYINLYSDGGGGAAADTSLSYEYRRISLTFYTSWLNQSDYVKQDNVIHECVHFFVNSLFHEARQIVMSTCEDNEKLKDYAFEKLRMSVESVTQDLCYAIQNKFKNER